MTEPERDPAAEEPRDPASDEILDILKAGTADADESDVRDGFGGDARMTWNSVTDAGGQSADAPPAGSGFQFDLGGALARLAGKEGDGRPADGQSAPPATPAPEPPSAPPPPSPSSAPLPSQQEAPLASPSSPPVPSGPSVEPLPSRSQVPPASPPSPPVPSAPSAPSVEPLPSRSQVPPASPPSPPSAPLPSRSQQQVPEPLPWRVEQPPVVEPLAPRVEQPTTEPAHADPEQYPRRVPGTHFDPNRGGAATEPPAATAAPVETAPAPAAPTDDGSRAIDTSRAMQRQSVFDDVASSGASAGSAPAGVAPSLPAAQPSGAVPSLPSAPPASSPSVAAPVSSAPSTPDINALRSAQIRQSKQQRQGKLFGRSLLAFVVLGGLLGGALVFGRSLLFPTTWDAQLTPLVNEIQDSRGVEFTEVASFEVLPAPDFGARLSTATFGPTWPERVPEWRALGLATGDVSVGSVAPALAESVTAFFDPSSNTIYQVEGVDPASSTGDLRVALEQVLERQLAAQSPEPAGGDGDESAAAAAPAPVGVMGVSPLSAIAERAVDRVLAAGGSVDQRLPADERLPLPLAYELAAVDSLGEAVLAAAGVDPSTLVPGGSYPDSIDRVLDDGAVATTSGLLQPGEVSLADPVALGPDDWSLVWGARLPASTVAGLVDQVVADSYRPVDRGGVVCVVGIFETASPEAGAAVLASMQTWAAGAPTSSQAVASQLGPNRIQIEACDPGAGGGVEPNPGAVDALIDRQQRRLTN